MAAVAVIGPATIDRVVQGCTQVCQCGGVVTYAGLTFANLGLDTRVLTNIAAANRSMLAFLQQSGIGVHIGESPDTTRFVNFVDGDQRQQEVPSRAAPIGAGQLEPVLLGVEHVHLGPLAPGDLCSEVLEAFGADIRVSLDIQGYVRQVEDDRVIPGISTDLLAALQSADLVKASLDELELVLVHFGQTLVQLMRDCAIAEWVVTDGSRGGWIMDPAGRRTEFAADHIGQLVDPTGAGDVFFAAYLVARLHRRDKVESAASFAAAFAPRQVAGLFIKGSTLQLEDGPFDG